MNFISMSVAQRKKAIGATFKDYIVIGVFCLAALTLILYAINPIALAKLYDLSLVLISFITGRLSSLLNLPQAEDTQNVLDK